MTTAEKKDGVKRLKSKKGKMLRLHTMEKVENFKPLFFFFPFLNF